MAQKSSAEDARLNLILPLELKRRLVKSAAAQGKKVSASCASQLRNSLAVWNESNSRRRCVRLILRWPGRTWTRYKSSSTWMLRTFERERISLDRSTGEAW